MQKLSILEEFIMKIIDMRVRAPFAAYANCNLYSPALISDDGRGGARNWVLPPSVKAFSMDLLIEEANTANVEKLVVPVRKNLGGRNEDLVELIQKYPSHVVGLAGIDVNSLSMQTVVQEIEQFVVNGPCQGIILEPGQDKTPWMVNDVRVFPVYEYCQQHNIPIFMTYGGIMVPSIRYYAPEPLDDVLGAFPKLKIGLAHGGWPYVTEVCQMAVNRNNLYLAPDFYMIESPGQTDYVMAANCLLQNRLMFASAYPLMPLKESSEYYMNSGIKEEILPNVMYHNAAEFLDLMQQ